MITAIVSAIKGPMLSALGGHSGEGGNIVIVALELGSNLNRYAR